MTFELAGHLLVLGFAALVLLSTFVFVVIDMFSRADYIRDNRPWLGRILERRGAIGVLLLVGLFLLIGDGYELLNKEVPAIPPAPVVLLRPAPLPFTVSVLQEPTNSLRQRTLRLADEVERFLVERQTNPSRPPFAGPDSRDPNPSDERKRAIQLYRDYAQATSDKYARLYRDRMVGIVKEYQNKGVPTGFLESGLRQHEPYIVAGSVAEGSWGDDLAQFRNLAYHVDAYDNLITVAY